MMMKLLIIIGVILLLPIAIVLVGMAVITLLGGYIGFIVSAFWEALVAVASIFIVYKIIKYMIKKKG